MGYLIYLPLNLPFPLLVSSALETRCRQYLCSLLRAANCVVFNDNVTSPGRNHPIHNASLGINGNPFLLPQQSNHWSRTGPTTNRDDCSAPHRWRALSMPSGVLCKCAKQINVGRTCAMACFDVD